MHFACSRKSPYSARGSRHLQSLPIDVDVLRLKVRWPCGFPFFYRVSDVSPGVMVRAGEATSPYALHILACGIVKFSLEEDLCTWRFQCLWGQAFQLPISPSRNGKLAMLAVFTCRRIPFGTVPRGVKSSTVFWTWCCKALKGSGRSAHDTTWNHFLRSPTDSRIWGVQKNA